MDAAKAEPRLNHERAFEPTFWACIKSVFFIFTHRLTRTDKKLVISGSGGSWQNANFEMDRHCLAPIAARLFSLRATSQSRVWFVTAHMIVTPLSGSKLFSLVSHCDGDLQEGQGRRVTRSTLLYAKFGQRTSRVKMAKYLGGALLLLKSH